MLQPTDIDLSQATKLPLMEAFHTIQGEGFHQGKPAFFIRLAGCDVGCHWCDVKESWDVSQYSATSCDEILAQAMEYPSRIAVITGGEPLMHDLSELTRVLRSNGFKTHLETSGAHPLSGEWDWICLSPKKFKAPLPGAYKQANELKVIIYNQSDYPWAIEQAKFVLANCNLFLQPEWSKSEQVTPELVGFIKKNPGWRISLQLHKFLGIP